MSAAADPSRPRPGTIWSIGRYVGPSPLELGPDPAVSNPILVAADVDDMPAEFVADPFLIRRDGLWYLFFEALHAETRRGAIGLAFSADARSWSYQGIVLAEDFHLSYPHVFAHGADVFMTPETLAVGRVLLYRANPFPGHWRREAELVVGRAADPTSFHDGRRWWLFACSPVEGWQTLRLYSSPHLDGPWHEHPQSPVVAGDPRRARPAGRVVTWEGRRLRFAQDCVPAYGTALRGFEILELSDTRFAERPTVPEVVLSAGPQRWNSGRVHHVDAHEIAPGRWIAAIDGTEPLLPMEVVDRDGQ
jgi:hypothetical protein